MVSNKSSNIKSLAAAFMLAGAVLTGSASAYAEPMENAQSEQVDVSEVEIAQKITALLKEAEALEGEEAVARMDSVDELTEDIDILQSPIVLSAVFEGLIPLLRHENSSVRLQSVFVIGMVGVMEPDCAGRALSLLDPMRNDPDSSVRQWASSAIRGIIDDHGPGVLSRKHQCDFNAIKPT